jgi:tyrocidine synthetase-3
LRTTFKFSKDKLVQSIIPKVHIKVKKLSIGSTVGGNEKQKIDSIINKFIKPFDLSKGPLIRIGVAELDVQRYLFIIDLHHIIADGLSLGIFINEFLLLYNGKKLSNLTLQYKDFSEWQNNLIKDGVMKQQESYWLERYTRDVSTFTFPGDFPNSEDTNTFADKYNFIINDTLINRLHVLQRKTKTTSFMVLLSIYNILLMKYCNQEDIVVCVPISGRTHIDLENIFGMFVNTLAVRCSPTLHKRFNDFLLEVKQNVISAFENQDYPFDDLIEKLDLPHNAGKNPLSDVAFNMVNTDVVEAKTGELNITPYDYGTTGAKFSLLMRAIEDNNCIQINLEYNSSTITSNTIHRIRDDFLNIIQQVTDNDAIPIIDIELASIHDKKPSLQVMNKDSLNLTADFELS